MVERLQQQIAALTKERDELRVALSGAREYCERWKNNYDILTVLLDEYLSV